MRIDSNLAFNFYHNLIVHIGLYRPLFLTLGLVFYFSVNNISLGVYEFFHLIHLFNTLKLNLCRRMCQVFGKYLTLNIYLLSLTFSRVMDLKGVSECLFVSKN